MRLGKALQSKNNSAKHRGDAVVVIIEMSGVLLRKQEPRAAKYQIALGSCFRRNTSQSSSTVDTL
jgi:hypothetical protein